MKIHFSASLEDIDGQIETYRKICSTIRDNGHELVRDWIEQAYAHRTRNYTDSEARDIATATRNALAECDLAIFEISDQSFGIGYQAALAVSLQKPILILQKQYSRPLGTIGVGFDLPLRDYVVYDSVQDVDAIIMKFIKKNDVSTKDLRFNLVLERDLLYFLTNESEQTGISKSQIVRDLIRKAARKKSESL